MERDEFKSNIISNLNAAQRDAVEYCDGPQLVIACAGSGKTRVLTHKIAYLIASGLEPYQIMALTFTRKAAAEMKERINKLFGGQRISDELMMGTFHSVFARILRIEWDNAGLKKNFIIYDQGDSRNVINDIINDLQLKTNIYSATECRARISWLKNNRMFSSADYMQDEGEQSKDYNIPKIGEIFAEYEKRLISAGAIDFDDILLVTYKMLCEHPEVAEKWGRRFEYILVDEYQDTNTVQDKIVRILSNFHKRVCVVGDDAQSIYAFRGAVIENILGFERSYTGAKVFKLEENYRSTPDIIGSANDVIYTNKRQIRKDVFTENPDGEKVKIVNAINKFKEAEYIANLIAKETAQGQKNYNDYTILYRMNSQSSQVEKELRKKKLPYRIYGALSFFQREEIKNFMAYLKLVVTPDDDESFKQIFDYPARRIADRTLKAIKTCADKHGLSLFETLNPEKGYDIEFANKGLMRHSYEFYRMICDFITYTETHGTIESMTYIYEKSTMKKLLENDKTELGQERLENISEFFNIAKSMLKNDMTLSDFVSAIAIDGMSDDLDDDKPKIKLMTIHGSKGLEFDTVFILGCIEGIFPMTKVKDKKVDIEEETRLAYVGMTRAKQRLYMLTYEENYMWGNVTKANESRFTKAVSENYSERFKFRGVSFSESLKMTSGDYFDVDNYVERKIVFDKQDKELLSKFEKFKDNMCYMTGQKRMKLFLNSMSNKNAIGKILRELLEAVSAIINCAKYPDGEYKNSYYSTAENETNKAIRDILEYNKTIGEEEKIGVFKNGNKIVFVFPNGNVISMMVNLHNYLINEIAEKDIVPQKDKLETIEEIIKFYFDEQIKNKYKVDESGVCGDVRKLIEKKEKEKKKYEERKKKIQERSEKIKKFLTESDDDVFSAFDKAELIDYVSNALKETYAKEIISYIEGVYDKAAANVLKSSASNFHSRNPEFVKTKVDERNTYLVANGLPVLFITSKVWKKCDKISDDELKRLGNMKDFINVALRNFARNGSIFKSNNSEE